MTSHRFDEVRRLNKFSILIILAKYFDGIRRLKMFLWGEGWSTSVKYWYSSLSLWKLTSFGFMSGEGGVLGFEGCKLLNKYFSAVSVQLLWLIIITATFGKVNQRDRRLTFRLSHNYKAICNRVELQCSFYSRGESAYIFFIIFFALWWDLNVCFKI